MLHAMKTDMGSLHAGFRRLRAGRKQNTGRRNLIDNGAKFDFKPEKLNEGITCMGQVNYVSVSGNALQERV